MSGCESRVVPGALPMVTTLGNGDDRAAVFDQVDGGLEGVMEQRVRQQLIGRIVRGQKRKRPARGQLLEHNEQQLPIGDIVYVENRRA